MIIIFKVFPSFKRANTILVVIASLLIILTVASENHNFDRAFRFSKAVLTLDEKQIIKVDGSGAHRIVQSFRGARFVGLNDKDDWVGHGIDADQKLIPNWQSSYLPGGAGMFFLWVNYGFLACMLWWCFSFHITLLNHEPLISTFIWLLTIFIMGGLNNQIIWLVLTISYCYKILDNKFMIVYK